MPAGVIGFVRAAVSKFFQRRLPVHWFWPADFTEPAADSDGADEFAQLPDQDRLEVDFTLGRLPVGPLEGRLHRAPQRLRRQRHIVTFGLIKQSGPLFFITIDVRGIHRAQLSAQGDEGDLQFLAITPQCSGELARPRLGTPQCCRRRWSYGELFARPPAGDDPLSSLDNRRRLAGGPARAVRVAHLIEAHQGSPHAFVVESTD